MSEARAAGHGLRVTSAYRSARDQQRIFAATEARYGPDFALASTARPGHSEHHLGTTLDIEGADDWLADNAWRSGFVVSYPPEHSPWSTCYKPEPWHVRYLGRDLAREVTESGLSLCEWLWTRQ